MLDAVSQRTALVDPNGHRTTFQYEPTGALRSELDPLSRRTTYACDADADDAVNRLSFLADDDDGAIGTQLAEYSYLGLGHIVRVDYPEPGLRYDLAHGTGADPYAGLDRFGRIVDLLWHRTDGSSSSGETETDIVQIRHGYDRAGNRLWREDPVAASYGKHFDELYEYDGMNQLTSLQRGDLNANKTAVTSKTFGESWTLDPTGNWCTFRQDTDGDGDWDLDQAREHNEFNEITQIDGAAAHVAHDRCGNMTRIPKPDDWSAHYDLTYDAWNRLVRVEDGATQDLIAEYQYDGRNYRITKTLPAESPNSSSSSSGTTTETETRHFYYNHAWQCLEERLEADADPSSSSGTPGDPPSTPDRQFIWGPRYIDDLILRDRTTSTPPDGQLDERLYALQDPNWNVVGVGTLTGLVTERYTYRGYGNLAVLSDSFSLRDSSSYCWDVFFTGRRLDNDTGFRYHREWSVSVALGRFVSRDPLKYLDGANILRYARANPVNMLDPSGQKCRVDFVCQRDPAKDVRTPTEVTCYYDCKEVRRRSVGHKEAEGCWDLDRLVPRGEYVLEARKRDIALLRRTVKWCSLGTFYFGPEPKCPNTILKALTYNFTPDDPLFPKVDYDECVAKCGTVDAVSALCGAASGPWTPLCELVVGSGYESCMTYCETFGK